jgi:hypothetical protein
MDLPATLALLIFAFWAAAGADLAIGFGRSVPRLKPLPPGGPEGPRPRVSIVFAMRDEGERMVGPLSSMLSQDYPDYEVIAVDDRSGDRMAERLRRLPLGSRFRLVEVRELPAGWIGKSHALFRGYEASDGEWIVFTDADVYFHPGALRAAVRAAESRGLDHLSLFPSIPVHGFWEAAFVGAFTLAFNLRFRPWAARRRRSRAFVGIGSFNMVRRSAYERIGTHRALRYDVADDMALGKLVKRAGLRQMIAAGDRLISVRWLQGFGGIFRSLEKNGYAGLAYHPALLAAGVAVWLTAALGPYAMLAAGGPAAAASAGSIAVIFAIHVGRLAMDRWALLAFAGFPAGALLFAAVCLASAAQAHRRGGVVWRGTLYPLAELRNHRVL